MRRTFLTCAIILLALSSFVVASTNSELEAEVFYKSAEGYIRDGDYENAIMSVYRARDIYYAFNNSWGVERSDKIIAQIESVLSPIQLADRYYNIAGTYFLQTQNEIEVLDRSIEMATRAKTIYSQIGGAAGTSGKLKCEDLILRAQKKRGDIILICIRAGDELYDKSSSSLFLENFIDARDYATGAGEKYVSCPHQAGVDKAANLLTRINEKINDLRMQAKASYEKAVQYFSQGSEESKQKCIEFAVAAQSIYTKVGDQEGSSSATSLASRCREMINQNDEMKMREAAEYMKDAKDFIISKDCINSTDRSNKAKAIYQEFYDKALPIERELPPQERVKLNLYDSYLNDVNSLLSRIVESCNVDQMLRIAEDFYRRSQEFYLENNLNEAMAYGNNARNLFFQYKNYVGMSKCDTLINQIKLRVNQRNEADGYMKSASANFKVANFDEAMTQASRAKQIYALITDRKNLAVADEFMAKTQEAMKQLDDNHLVYSKARTAFEQRNWDGALSQATQANGVYASLNYTLGITESQTIIDESQKQIDLRNSEWLRNIMAVTVTIIVCGAIIFHFTRKKTALETDFKTKIAREEERVRRHDEEFSIRTEEETKSRVDDELRRLIDTERGKLEENEKES